MKKLLMIVGGVALAGIAAYVLIDRPVAGKPAADKPAADKPIDKPVAGTEDPLESLAWAILADGEARAFEKIHAAASEDFKVRNAVEELRARFLLPRGALGRRMAIGKITIGEIDPATDGGPTVKVSVELSYERGPSRADFRFVKQEGLWKLLELSIDYDPSLAPRPDASTLEQRSRDLLALYDARSYKELYAAFSHPLKASWKTDTAEPRMPALREQLGKVVAAKLVPAPAPQGDGQEVEVKLEVTFEHGSGEATFGWMWAWALGDEDWHLVAFDIKPGVR